MRVRLHTVAGRALNAALLLALCVGAAGAATLVGVLAWVVVR